MVSGDQINRQKSLKTDTMNEAVILKKFLSVVTPKMHKVEKGSVLITFTEGMDLGLTDPLFRQPFVEVQTPIKSNEKGFRPIITLTTTHPRYSVGRLDDRSIAEYHHRTAINTDAPNFLFCPKSSKTKFVVSYGIGNVQTAESLISSIEGNE